MNKNCSVVITHLYCKTSLVFDQIICGIEQFYNQSLLGFFSIIGTRLLML